MRPIVLARPENESYVNHKLCSTCEQLLNRPQHHWNADKITQIGYSKRLYDDIISSANNGCPICKNLQSSIFASPHLQPGLMDRELACTLYWDKEAEKFDAIRFSMPLVHFKLFLEEGMKEAVESPFPSYFLTIYDACLNLATEWIMNCIKTHPQCNRTTQEACWLPTRLIDIGTPEGDCSPRLINAAEITPDKGQTHYIALTHRWGTKQTITLTSKNINDLQQKIPLEELPETFKDAILFTRRLGIRYLWIDSLCIQQDCEIEWAKESAIMGSVYERSYCNIAATAAAAGHESLFVDRDVLSHIPLKLNLNWEGHQKTYYCLYSDLWYLGVTKTPLNRRGWVVQERLLSPRTLSFNTQLFWECRELKACESFPQGLGADENFSHDDIDEDSELCSKAWTTEITGPCARYDSWTRVVEQFMVCKLTKAEDKLIAVSGVAKVLKSVLGDNYVAGLWERNLTFDLLWYVENGRQGDWRDSIKVEPYRAPSWSWASVEGRVHFARGHRDYSWGPPLVEILTIKIESTSNDVTGQLTGGHILASGLLLRLQALREVWDHALALMPGCGTAYCLDDWQDLSLENVFFFPVRSMKSANGVELLGLILTSKSDGFRRVGLLAIKCDEIGEFEWDTEFDWDKEHCTGWLNGQSCNKFLIKLV